MNQNVTAARRHLGAADPVLGGILRRVRLSPPGPRRTGTHFEALARAIVFQQLSGKAAGTIHGRVLDLYPARRLRPDLVLATDDATLRAAGLSRQKIGYLRDLTAKVGDGTLPLARLDRLDDEALIERLTRVKGIGRWTVQMFLMFRLGRPDVLPELDLGVQVHPARLRPEDEADAPGGAGDRREVGAVAERGELVPVEIAGVTSSE